MTFLHVIVVLELKEDVIAPHAKVRNLNFYYSKSTILNSNFLTFVIDLILKMVLFFFFLETISLHMSMKVDRVGDRRIVWSGNYGNPESEEYKTLEWEAKHAVSFVLTKIFNYCQNLY